MSATPTSTDGSEPQYTSPGAGSGGQSVIEVNNTIRVVLISLGVVVAVLFLLGVIATYYISHKNKKAEGTKGKLESGEQPPTTAPESTVDPEKSVDPKNREQQDELREVRVSREISGMDEDKENYAGVGCTRPSIPGMEYSYNHNNEGGQLEASSLGMARTGTGMTGLIGGAGCHNNRNSIIGVASVYTHRQSMIDPLGLPPSSSGYQDLKIGFPQSHSHDYQNQQRVSSIVAPPSAGSNSVLLDPFKINNNSSASLGHLISQQKLAAHETFSSHRRSIASTADGDISYQPPSQPTSSVHAKYSSSLTSPRAAFRNGAAVFEGVTTPRSARPSLDETEAENVIVSLPSPRGCLLEAAGADGGDGDSEEYITDEQDMDGAYSEYPEVILRAPNQHYDQGKDKVKSSYLDDYREQQQQQQQKEQQESPGFGKRLSIKLLERINLSSS
ncbi:hypothetical protein BGZ80_002987 [Entomortierella chlamydospora]|uniref:Uncharacterized protein n=1 Tax=Entomortierella chlamydospora TaxID=101097 RepID=A0A9P6MNT0_9FUNG|nr:hypothetical protein BGZ79_002668 [Entomortierella chlamydospora]KAG0008850.1 hypothetical protein BGZ80_002987 [Entomortierella chlamydospora]